jgi:glucokinase
MMTAHSLATQSFASQALAIGVDIGGTKMSAALVDVSRGSEREGSRPVHLISERFQVPTPKTPETFVEAIAQLVRQCQAVAPVSMAGSLPVGIASAGIINHKAGEILGSTGNLPAITYHPFPLGKLVSEKTGLPVHVENDANAAAYGEGFAGAARGIETYFMITLGTGVGCGLVIDGQLLRGRHFSAGEAGHIRISLTNDRRCTCGKIGCWEIYASGTGLAVTGRRELAEVLHSPDARDLLGDQDADEITTHAIIEGYQRGNRLAEQLVDKWHFFVATGLGSLMNTLDPDAVVIGGGMAKFVEPNRLKRYLHERVMGNIPQTPILMAELDNQAGFIGAAKLAHESFSARVAVV